MLTAVDVRSRVCGGHVVVELRGELDTAGTAETAAVMRAATAGGRRIIVDMADLQFIDCGALGVLVHARKLARQAGGDVLLASPHGPARRVLALTGLDQTFGIHASVADAAACP